ncbi:MAG: SDR family oxidoreductase [Elusimicrobiota bacterium]
MNLRGKVVIITGASSGVGKATAVEFAKHGAKIALAARRIDRLEEIKNYILNFNTNCIAVKTDVSVESDVKNLFEETEKAFGQIDVVVNNAGKGLRKEIQDISFEEWNSLMETNVNSVFLCTREAVRRMNHGGHILTVSSVAGLYGVPPYSAYCASKHAVTGFNRVMFWELKKHKIKVSTIYPARIATEFFNDYKEKPKRHQMLMPEDIGRYIYALATRSPIKILKAAGSNFLKRVLTFLTPH